MTTTVENPVAENDKTTRRGPRLGEWFIAAALLAFFVFGYLAAQAWPFRAALFPQMVSALGLFLVVLRFGGLILQTIRGRRVVDAVTPVQAKVAQSLGVQPADSSPEAQQVRVAAQAADTPQEPQKLTDLAIIDEEAEEDESMEYVFASAGGRAWAEALAWIVLFFVGFFVLGAFITVPLFALVYLRVAGKASWLAAAIYAAVVGLIIYYVFRELVYIPLPVSVFPFLEI